MREKRVLPIFLLWLLYGLNLNYAFAQDAYLIPGDARRGWQIFATKGCIKCHSIGEEGKKIGPDLSKNPSHHLSAAGLAANMWNHAPDMWKKISAKGVKIKRFKKTEMADLFAFLYFIRYLDEPGNPAKGEEVYR